MKAWLLCCYSIALNIAQESTKCIIAEITRTQKKSDFVQRLQIIHLRKLLRLTRSKWRTVRCLSNFGKSAKTKKENGNNIWKAKKTNGRNINVLYRFLGKKQLNQIFWFSNFLIYCYLRVSNFLVRNVNWLHFKCAPSFRNQLLSRICKPHWCFVIKSCDFWIVIYWFNKVT